MLLDEPSMTSEMIRQLLGGATALTVTVTMTVSVVESPTESVTVNSKV